MDTLPAELHKTIQKLDESLILSELEELSPKVRIALQFLEHKFPEGIGVPDAASCLKMHPASLWKRIRGELFQCGIHMSLSEYTNRLRVVKAKELLQSDPFLLSKELAPMVGTGVRNLQKLFKTYTGKTPSEYRVSVLRVKQ